jgi:hypothetical protein
MEAAERTDVGRNTLKILGGEMKQVFMVMPSGRDRYSETSATPAASQGRN